MEHRLTLEEQFEILRATDLDRPWYSIDDKRVCAVCERIISGREIEIRGGPGWYALRCPTMGCPSTYTDWNVYRPPVLSALPHPG